MYKEKDRDLRSSMEIISISAKYIIASVLLVAIGAVGIVYAVLIYFVYGLLGLSYAVFIGFFLGAAFVLIGVFLTFWGLYWMRKEGSRIRRKYQVGPEEKIRKTKIEKDQKLEKKEASANKEG